MRATVKQAPGGFLSDLDHSIRLIGMRIAGRSELGFAITPSRCTQ